MIFTLRNHHQTSFLCFTLALFGTTVKRRNDSGRPLQGSTVMVMGFASIPIPGFAPQRVYRSLNSGLSLHFVYMAKFVGISRVVLTSHCTTKAWCIRWIGKTCQVKSSQVKSGGKPGTTASDLAMWNFSAIEPECTLWCLKTQINCTSHVPMDEWSFSSVGCIVQ